MQSLSLYTALSGISILLAQQCLAQQPPCNPLTAPKPRVFIMSDISNEPDDSMSFVRLLAHSDMYDVTGMVACTSVQLNQTTPDAIHAIINGYTNVTDNLQAHTTGTFPTTDYLHSIVRSGPNIYGSLALTNSTLSPGSELMIETVDASDAPLYVQIWGGANALAQALQHVQLTRSPSDLETFLSKLRIYTISDQDDTGFLIRRNYPTLRYISSTHAWLQYGLATWSAMSADAYGATFDRGGPNSSLVSPEFIARNFQVGPLGAHYPTPEYIMEGDSPSMLYSMQNGLNSPEHPEWGSWGGRYGLADISGRSGHYADAVDSATVAGQLFQSNYASVWRWREAVSYEFAARMKWSLSSDYGSAPHPPVAVLNGSCGYDHLDISAKVGEKLTLNGSASTDTDNETLTFNWLHYREPSLTQSSISEVTPLNFTCTNDDCSSVSFQLPTFDQACKTDVYLMQRPGFSRCQTLHVVMSVTGGKNMGMTRYKRAVIALEP